MIYENSRREKRETEFFQPVIFYSFPKSLVIFPGKFLCSRPIQFWCLPWIQNIPLSDLCSFISILNERMSGFFVACSSYERASNNRRMKWKSCSLHCSVSRKIFLAEKGFLVPLSLTRGDLLRYKAKNGGEIDRILLGFELRLRIRRRFREMCQGNGRFIFNPQF